jgi:nucleoside 2-deoxyribosyltransferase
MTPTPRVYLAGPLGFSEAGRHFHTTVLVPLVARLGFDVVDPWTLIDAGKVAAVQRMPHGPERREAWRAVNAEIGAANRAAIDSAEAMLAVLDGPDVDSGTAAEIGYAFARGKRIVGYRGDARATGENEGAAVNLQVEYFIRQSGGTIVHRSEDLAATLRSLPDIGPTPQSRP